MKICSRCGLEKADTDFRTQKGRNLTRSNCKACDTERHKEWRSKNREHLRAYDRSRYRVNEDRWEHHLRRKYDISSEEYIALLDGQGGGCAICECSGSDNKNERLNVDHCHRSGNVRGLLCWNCNTALGKMNDDAKQLRAAADYLERHQSYRSKRELS